MSIIMSMIEFKSLNKANKIKRLNELRQKNSDKDIRDAWGMTYGAYDYYLKTLGLKESINPLNETVVDRQRANSGKKEIIDLSYTVVQDEPPINPKFLDPQLALEAPKTAAHMISYPSVTGNVAQLRKRLEAIMTLVELDGEDAELVLSITIDRK